MSKSQFGGGGWGCEGGAGGSASAEVSNRPREMLGRNSAFCLRSVSNEVARDSGIITYS